MERGLEEMNIFTMNQNLRKKKIGVSDGGRGRRWS